MPTYTAWSGQDIKTMRLTLGLTQRGLAAEVGCYTHSLSDWETGRKLPSPIFNKLLTQFANSVGYFKSVGDTTTPNGNPAANHRQLQRT